MRTPHPIPYQGSKRSLARYILPFFPPQVKTLFEPFAGSAAVSIAAAIQSKAEQYHLNDINQPLVALWGEIIHNPGGIASQYESLWQEQKGIERKYYDIVRDNFNQTKRPDFLLYLLARCVKASVRYNANGDFNQSPDNRRIGRAPEMMTADIFMVSSLLRNKVKLTSVDYKEILAIVTPEDLVYLDPPYQGVSITGDPRYYRGVDLTEFLQELERLNRRGVPFILSYDGRTGKKSYGRAMPEELGMYRLEIDAGRSTQATLLGRDDITFESVYLSKNLVASLQRAPKDVIAHHVGHQLALF